MQSSCNNSGSISSELHIIRVLQVFALLFYASLVASTIPLLDQQAAIVQRLQQDVQELRDRSKYNNNTQKLF